MREDDIFTFGLSVYRQQFGSWSAALTAADLDIDQWNGETTLTDAGRLTLKSLAEPDWPTLRAQTLEADGEVCRRCGLSQSEHYAAFNAGLHVHLISPLTQFCVDHCGFDTEPTLSTLITLCGPCHAQLEGVASSKTEN